MNAKDSKSGEIKHTSLGDKSPPLQSIDEPKPLVEVNRSVPPLRTKSWSAEDDGITTATVRNTTEVLPKRTIVRARLRPEISNMIEDASWLVKSELRALLRQQTEGDKPIAASRVNDMVRALEKLQSMELREEARENPVVKTDDELVRGMLRDPVLRRIARRVLDEYDD